jgi:hypothetical protein
MSTFSPTRSPVASTVRTARANAASLLAAMSTGALSEY